MANRNLKASVIIGGAITGAFRSALATTNTGLKKIGSAIADVDRKQRQMGQSIQTFGRMGKNVDGLRAKYGDLTRQAENLRRAYARLETVESRLDRNRKAITASRNAFGTAIGATAAMALPMGAAANKAATFQYQNQMIGNTAEMSPAEIGALSKAILQSSKDANQSTENVQQAIGFLVAAGMNFKTAKASIRTIGRTTTAAGAEIEDLSKASFTLIDSLKIAPDGLQRALDALAYAGKEGNVELKDMAKVMPVLGSSFVALKMQGLEATATMGAALEVARKGAADADEAANNMRNFMAKMMSPDTLKKARKNFGMDLYAVIQEAQTNGGNPFEAAMQAIMKATAGDQKKIGELFQDMQVQNFLRPMIQNWDEYTRIKNEALNNSAGTTDRDFDKVMATSRAKMDAAKNAAGRLGITFGTVLLPAIGNAAAKMGALMDRMDGFIQRHPRLTATVSGSALGMGALATAVTGGAFAFNLLARPVLLAQKAFAKFQAARALGQIGRVGTTVARVGGTFRTLGAVIGAIGGGPVALLVGALTVGALLVRKYWEPIKAWVGGVFEGLRAAVGPALAEVGAALAPFKPAWDAVAGAIGRCWDWLMQLLAPVHLTGSELDGAALAGRRFGAVLGTVIGNGLRGFAAMIRAIGWIVGKLSALPRLIARVPIIGTGAQALMVAAADAPAPGGASARRPTQLRGRQAPPMPEPSGRGPAPTQAPQVKEGDTYHITQLPGESGEELARRIAAEQARRKGVQGRGALADAG